MSCYNHTENTGRAPSVFHGPFQGCVTHGRGRRRLKSGHKNSFNAPRSSIQEVPSTGSSKDLISKISSPSESSFKRPLRQRQNRNISGKNLISGRWLPVPIRTKCTGGVGDEVGRVWEGTERVQRRFRISLWCFRRRILIWTCFLHAWLDRKKNFPSNKKWRKLWKGIMMILLEILRVSREKESAVSWLSTIHFFRILTLNGPHFWEVHLEVGVQGGGVI